MIKIIITLFVLCISIGAFSHPGVGIVMDSKGNVFYTDLKRVWKIDTNGKVSIAVKFVHTHELYIDQQDNLFGEHVWYEGEATDKWGHYVWKLFRSGRLEKIVPPTEGFLETYSFVHDDHGNMFKADRTKPCQHVVKLTSNNKESQVAEYCFDDIRWMTASQKGNIFLIDRMDLKRISPGGEVEIVASNLHEKKLSQFMVNDRHMVMGVWTDDQENAYVAIYGGRMVKKVSPDKKITTVAETSVGWSPTGGLVAPNGDFWLLECSPANTVRVERITTDGKRKVYSATE
jgi:hypothetical protein